MYINNLQKKKNDLNRELKVFKEGVNLLKMEAWFENCIIACLESSHK